MFVGNFAWSLTQEQIARAFSGFGTIEAVNVPQANWGRNNNRGYAFVTFATPAEAAHVVSALHGRYIEGLYKNRDGLRVQYSAAAQPPPAPSP